MSENARKEFDFLKGTITALDAEIKAIPMQDGGHLIPLCQHHVGDKETVATLIKWRNAHPYLVSIVDVTEASMIRWMKQNVIGNPTRMLFLVRDRYGKLSGTIGIANCTDTEVEIDSVQRGEPDATKGVMREALSTLIRWVKEVLNSEIIYLRVTDDNQHGREFYKRNGFVESNIIPLRMVVNDHGKFYRELELGDTEPPDRNFVRMTYVGNTSREAGTERKKQLQTSRPSISSRERYYAWNAVNMMASDYHGYIRKFEESLSRYFGGAHVIATSSCTGALHTALLAMGIEQGDEVIVPETTWVSSGTSVMMCGANPVFCDINPFTWTMDPNAIEALITPKTKAIMPVHVYGYPADMRSIMEVATKHKLMVIEDAAAAIGALAGGNKCGNIGDVGCFSLQGAKTITSGEGGFIVTRNEGIARKARKLINQGRNETTPFWIDIPGVRYSISNVQAAVALAQFERMEEFNRKKRRIHEWYRDALIGKEGITLYVEPEYGMSNYWMNSVVIPEWFDRDKICKELKERGIETRPVFPAISQYGFWKKYKDLGMTAKIYGDFGINLPSALNLTKADVAYVCNTLLSVIS